MNTHSGASVVPQMRNWRPVQTKLSLPDLGNQRGILPRSPRDQSGNEGLEQIFGADNRVPVSNVSDAPLCAIAKLTATFSVNRVILGTGWFISPRVVVTAGHVLFDTAGTKANSVLVEPLLNGTAPFQFDSVSAVHSDGWDFSEGTEGDYAALAISSDYSAYFNFGIFSDNQVSSLTFSLAGYPNDTGMQNRMWAMDGILDSSTPSLLLYTLDTSYGQSGSPLFVTTNDGSFWAAGIHVGGNSQANQAVRINNSVFNTLMAWKGGIS